MCANDTLLLYSATNIYEVEIQVNIDIRSYVNWLNCSKLVINTTKTVYTVFKQKNKPIINIDVRIDGNLIGQNELDGTHIQCNN